MKRLVSFLGVGQRGNGKVSPGYDRVNYRWPRHQAPDEIDEIESPFVARALAEWTAADEIVIVGTKESFADHRVELTEALAGAELPPAVYVEIDADASPTAWWDLFEKLKDRLRGADEVIVDITHGFRALPFFAGAVLFFVSAVDENPPRFRVLYGKLEKDSGTGTIWELTEVLDLVTWALEIRLFLRSGQAEGLVKKAEALGSSLNREWAGRGRDGAQPSLWKLAKAIGSFGDAFAVGRTGQLLAGEKKHPTREILHLIEEAKEDLKLTCPPLADVLEVIQTSLEPLSIESLEGDDGREALASLCELYVRAGRPTQALELLREAWISHYSDPSARSPGAVEFSDEKRAQGERRWRREAESARTVAGLRNQVAHAGFARQTTLRDRNVLHRGLERAIAALRRAEPVGTEREAESMFVNISNHPSQSWGEKQRQAARDLASGLRDIPFPAVPTDATATDIESLAQELGKGIPPATTHAMVMGELSLSFALIRRLREGGITCVVATTDREVIEGDDTKVSRFHFKSFREVR